MAFTKEQKTKVIKEFKTTENDSGSSVVQIAVLTERIKNLTTHLIANKKDNSSKRGLEKMVNTRKKLLKYLQKTNKTSYEEIIKKLGLRK